MRVPERYRKSAKHRALYATMLHLAKHDDVGPVSRGEHGREVQKAAVDRVRRMLESRGADAFRDYLSEEATHVAAAVASGRDAAQAVESLQEDLRDTYEAVLRSSARSWRRWAASRSPLVAKAPLSGDPDVRLDEWIKATAAKRVVGIAETSRKRIALEIAAGTEAGETVQQIAGRVERLYVPDVSAARAEVIARTEVGVATNWAQWWTAQDSGVHMRKEWLSLADDRTRDDHVLADGQTVGVNQAFLVGEDRMLFPGDESMGAGPEQIINCRCVPAWTLVESRSILAATRRAYTGELVEVVTAAGDVLSATTNHPVLSPSGWVALGSLHEGDDLVRRRRAERVASSCPNINDGPTAIQKVFDALSLAHGRHRRVRSSIVDFHGDGRDGEVDIISPDRELSQSKETAALKHPGEIQLAAAHTHQVRANDNSTALIEVLQPQKTRFGATPRRYRMTEKNSSDNLTRPFDGGRDLLLRDAESVQRQDLFCDRSIAEDRIPPRSESIGARPQAFAELDEPAFHSHVPAPRLLGDLQEAESLIDVEVTKVARVSRYTFSGHVYNLHTESGWYVAQGIISHNCSVLYHVTEKSADSEPEPLSPAEFAMDVAGVQSDEVITALAFAKGVFGPEDRWERAREIMMKHVHRVRRASSAARRTGTKSGTADTLGRGKT